MGENQVQISDGAILDVIRCYTREAGVRNLERELASVCRKVARKVVGFEDRTKAVTVNSKSVESYLGVPKYRYGQPEEKEHVGLANGLAWTEVGGDVLTTEVVVMPGRGKLTITGKLGEVMQESAQAGVVLCAQPGPLPGAERRFLPPGGYPPACARRGHSQGRPLGRHHSGHYPW